MTANPFEKRQVSSLSKLAVTLLPPYIYIHNIFIYHIPGIIQVWLIFCRHAFLRKRPHPPCFVALGHPYPALSGGQAHGSTRGQCRTGLRLANVCPLGRERCRRFFPGGGRHCQGHQGRQGAVCFSSGCSRYPFCRLEKQLLFCFLVFVSLQQELFPSH